MIRSISIQDFVYSKDPIVLADVRTPAEFEHGHVPGAFNLPIFTNEERAHVGTTYTKGSREEAILLGFDLTASKWSGFIRAALEIAPDKKIALYCWRGGMRSGAMAWVLSFYGFEVFLIEGGYKKYRNWVHQQFQKKFNLFILGGMSGSGKTRLLHGLKICGEQIIDLEDLAQHQGSAYGSLGQLTQPSQEQFENNLAQVLKTLSSEKVWIEDESFIIGKCTIPASFWEQMQNAPTINLLLEREKRIASLVNEYGVLHPTFLVNCTQRISKRLGLEQARQATEAIYENRMEDFISIVLVYYDKTYRKAMAKRQPAKIFPISISGNDLTNDVRLILHYSKTINQDSKSSTY